MTKQYPSGGGRLVTVRITSEPPSSTFSSDNSAGAHPAVLEALARANHGHALAYGNDPITRRLEAHFGELFGRPVSTHLVWNGTGGNVLAIAALQRPGGAVICTDSSHLNQDETGAPERIIGTKLIDVPHVAGKLIPEYIDEQAAVLGHRHHAQPCTVSITQVTEYGTVYSPSEVAAICDTAHRHGMRVHLDGARIANAVAALGGTLQALRSFTVDAGVDAVTFGGTKNGMLYGEAVIFLEDSVAPGATYLHKQVTQLPSKMRFIAAQFEALLSDDLWLRNALQANSMAALLHESISDLHSIGCESPQANSLYPSLPPEVATALQDWSFFYPWNTATQQYRWMTAWDTSTKDIERFAEGIRCALST